tara:strand:- start:1684 stop:3975 length:2292 start_codon:yes stop_codon:yes gene_type:complete
LASKQQKAAEKVKSLFDSANNSYRQQWEKVNQKGFDFANDNQLTKKEKRHLEESGMPTFTVNRITPVVEMLNFYATANTPRWQAIGVEGSDSDVASVFSDVADYIWHNSHSQTLFSNAINDAVTKGCGYLMIDIDPDADQGMGEVVIKQPDPFDIYVDEKSRDVLFRDASYIMIRKVLPKDHLVKQYPEMKAKIGSASAHNQTEYNTSEKMMDGELKDFTFKDVLDTTTKSGKESKWDELVDYYELFEKEKAKFYNVFYKVTPPANVIKEITRTVDVTVAEQRAELEVQLKETEVMLLQQLEQKQILPERFELEMKKAGKKMEEELITLREEMLNKLISDVTITENKVLSEKELELFKSNKVFGTMIEDVVPFFDSKIKKTCVVGDKVLYEKYMPRVIKDYPIIPIHYKWTGTPYPISAVSPLIGKQQELNKVHQLMVHNASLGSSLRWMYEEGALDIEHWEKYASAPGALLPIRPGAQAPVPVQPFQLPNNFYTITGEGKADMEYLAGIYSSMQGDTSSSKDLPYRGMLAMDEYGTRRIKYWMKHCIEPGLRQIGELVRMYSQSVYTAHKVFRIVQPNALQEDKQVEINIPMYNDMGEVVGKYFDYATAKFDIRIKAGSTMPINRWAYLEELKSLMQMGVVDDVAVLAETDIKNKENIVKRKSLYAQMQSKIAELEETVKKEKGTNETLERQIVQSGIKGKVMQAESEIEKKKYDDKVKLEKEFQERKAEHKMLEGDVKRKAMDVSSEMDEYINNLRSNTKK